MLAGLLSMCLVATVPLTEECRGAGSRPDRALCPGPQPVSIGSRSESSNPPRRTRRGSRNQDGAIQEQGIWTQASFGVVVVPLPSGAASSTAGITLGYKWGRFVFAGALDFHYFHWVNDAADTSEHDFSLGIGPAVEVRLARKGRLGLHASGMIQFLLSHSEMDRPYGGSSGTAYGFALRAGGGARYYLAGSLGLGVEMGLDLGYLRRDSHNTLTLGPFGLLSVAIIW